MAHQKQVIVNIFRRKGMISSWIRKQHSESTIHTNALNEHRHKWLIPRGYETGVSVFNCITKSKVPMVLRSPDYLSWYICGPTVYDSAHLGHACCYVKFDIIRRILLNYFNINVVMMMGVTDIDDKIIIRAAEKKQDPSKLAEHYEKEFFDELAKLNVIPPTIVTKVTNFIPEIINFVQKIIDKGLAYVTEDGSVYFDTKKFDRYGKLFSQVPKDETGIEQKKSALDFALWKGTKPGEPWWASPWGPGRGRPGWHIECSAMASAVFGSSIDMHSGGIDLLFPHHENEEAQCCSYHGVEQWVNYWLHSGHLHIKGDEKMSKSLKNTISIHDFLSSFSANEFRVFCLLSPYRSSMEYSDAALENAVALTKKIESFLVDAEAYIIGYTAHGDVDEPQLLESLSNAKSRLKSALADDFDTVTAMNAILGLMSTGNKMLHKKPQHVSQPIRNPAAVAAVASFFKQSLEKFGFMFKSSKESSLPIDNSQQLQVVLDSVVQFRNQVRTNVLGSPHGDKDSQDKEQKSQVSEKNLTLLKACDCLRDDLLSVGIHIKDHGKMSTWNYKNKDHKQKR